MLKLWRGLSAAAVVVVEKASAGPTLRKSRTSASRRLLATPSEARLKLQEPTRDGG